MLKRGQLTLLIIIGLVIVVAIIGYFSLSTSDSKDSFSNPEANSKYNTLKDSIIECHSSLSMDIIELVSLQGGYYELPDEILHEENIIFDLPYYYYEGQEHLPSIESISNQIAKGIDENLATECINSLNNSHFEIEYNEIKTEIEITNKQIKSTTNMNLVVSNNDEKIILNINKYPTILDSKIYAMYDIAKFLTNENINDPNLMDIAGLTSMSENYNLYVSIINYNNDSLKTQIFISNNDTSTPSLFIYLNKYSEDKE